MASSVPGVLNTRSGRISFGMQICLPCDARAGMSTCKVAANSPAQIVAALPRHQYFLSLLYQAAAAAERQKAESWHEEYAKEVEKHGRTNADYLVQKKANNALQADLQRVKQELEVRPWLVAHVCRSNRMLQQKYFSSFLGEAGLGFDQTNL